MKLSDLLETGNPHYGELPRDPKNPAKNALTIMIAALKKQDPVPVDKIAKLEKKLKELG